MRELRAGTGPFVDLGAVVAELDGQVAVLEGGPSLAGVMVSQGLVDEFFVTLSPRVVAGGSARVVHGPDADAAPWTLEPRLRRRRRLPVPPLRVRCAVVERCCQAAVFSRMCTAQVEPRPMTWVRPTLAPSI